MKSSSITLNDRSETKDQDFEDFFAEDVIPKTADGNRRLTTDLDYENLFEELVDEYKPGSFHAFQEKVGEAFNHKLDDRLEKWAEKLALDRTKLKDLFYDDKR